MNKQIKNQYIAILLLGLISPLFLLTQQVQADEIDRLFTTKAERKKLDELRFAKKVNIEPIKIVIDEEPVEEKPEIGGITVNGLVYRKGGKSTAWINDSNTLEGNLGNQYIQVTNGDIAPENVEIKIHNSPTRIKLKVGESYDAINEEVMDITNSYTE